MATTITGIGQSKVINALDTYNHTALNNSLYKVSLQLTDRPTGGLTIAIKQNSSTIITQSFPSTTQNQFNLQAILNCSVNDVIGVVITSTSTFDTRANVLQGILNIHMGSS